MKPSPISVVMLVVFLFPAPALLAQSPDSANPSAASPAQSPSAAEVPRLIKFSGTLLDALTMIAGGAVMVIVAAELLVLSATEVAVSVTVAGEGTVPGAV